MDIGQYISDLLNEHNEVSLPGFGTFFKRSVSAYYNETEGLFYPPAEVIDFKSEETSSSHLVNYIRDSKHISETSALYFIERFCENLKNNINRDLNASILPLGILRKIGNSYQFEPSPTNGASSFGLKPIKEPGSITTNIPQIEDDLAPEEHLVLVEKKSRSGSKGIWVTLFVLLLIAAFASLAHFYYPDLFKNLNFQADNKPNTKIVTPVIKRSSVQDSVSFADSVVNELEKQGIHGAQVEKARDTLSSNINITKSPDSTETAPQPDKVYEIIVASFGLRKEAEVSVRNLRHRGIDAKIYVDVKKPKYKVSLGTFTTMTAANKEKRRIQQELIKDAWILTVTNKEN